MISLPVRRTSRAATRRVENANVPAACSSPRAWIASRALTARLMMTCSSWRGSARIGPRSRSWWVLSVILAPSSRLRSWLTSLITSGNWITPGRRGCWRLKARIGADRAEIAIVVGLERNLGAEQPFEELADLADHIGQLDHLGPQRLLAAESEELTRERGGAVGIGLDLLNVVVVAVARGVAQ